MMPEESLSREGNLVYPLCQMKTCEITLKIHAVPGLLLILKQNCYTMLTYVNLQKTFMVYISVSAKKLLIKSEVLEILNMINM